MGKNGGGAEGCCGKCLLNSTNHEDGEPLKVLELAWKYGRVNTRLMKRGWLEQQRKSLRSHSAPITKPSNCIHPTKSLILWHHRFPPALKKIEPMVALRLQPSAACQELPGCHIVGSFQYFFGLNCAGGAKFYVSAPGDGSWICGDRQLVKFSSVAD